MEVLAAGNTIIQGNYIHHSTFKRVVNFVHQDRPDLPLLSFGTRHTFFAANHLNLNDCAFNWIKKQKQLAVSDKIIGEDKEQLALPICRFSGQLPSSIPALGSKKWEDQVQALESLCHQFASTCDSSILRILFFPDHMANDGAFARMLHSRYHQLLSSELTSEASLKAIEGFRGLGIGLTPSGDDFIQGSLAALHILEIENQSDHSLLRAKIGQIGCGSNRYSQTFLQQALEQNYNSLVHSFLYQFIQGQNFDHELQAIFAYGETSGADWVAGFIWTLKRRTIW